MFRALIDMLNRPANSPRLAMYGIIQHPGRSRIMPRIGRLVTLGLLLLSTAAGQALAGEVDSSPSKMAPIEQYFMPDRDAEMALAKSAAPESISRNADVLVLGANGFETALKGTNGFVCLVARSWTSAADADFWDPRVKVPMCFNRTAVQSYFQSYVKATELAIGGETKGEIAAALAAAAKQGQLPAMEPGAMCYMMSKFGFGGNTNPHWPPHLMFFYPETDPQFWGANLNGSPVFAYTDSGVHVTSFVVAVEHWSDGTTGAPEITEGPTHSAPGPHVHG